MEGSISLLTKAIIVLAIFLGIVAVLLCIPEAERARLVGLVIEAIIRKSL